MPDLDSALDEIRRFASRPPGSTPAIDVVMERARRRHRRRRLGNAGLGVALLVGVVLAVRQDQPAQIRAVDEGPPSTEVAPDVADRLLVEPATGLEPGQVVTITLPEPRAFDAIVAQCASEAATASDPVPWCDLSPEVTPADGEGHFRVEVLRSIQTSYGIIDCAEQAERCVLGVRSGGRDRTAPISFREGLGPVEVGEIAVDRPIVGDGDVVVVSGTGFAPNAEVWLSQCRVDGGERSLESSQCDDVRNVMVVADQAGRFERQLLVYRELLSSEWVDCDPCAIRAGAHRQEPALAPIRIEVGSNPSRRPTVRIVPEGPYARGQAVQLQGTGFQIGMANIDIGWCRFNTDDPATEAQGAGPEYATCNYPATGLQGDAGGNFVVDDFRMPSQSWGAGFETCGAPEARCGLAWHPSEGSFPVFITWFEMLQGEP